MRASALIPLLALLACSAQQQAVTVPPGTCVVDVQDEPFFRALMGSCIGSTLSIALCDLSHSQGTASHTNWTARRKRRHPHQHTQSRRPRMTVSQRPLSRAICKTGSPNNRTTSGKCRTGRRSSKATSGTWSARCGEPRVCLLMASQPRDPIDRRPFEFLVVEKWNRRCAADGGTDRPSGARTGR